MTLSAWAQRHGVSPQALEELRALMGVITETPTCPVTGESEQAAQQKIRLAAPKHGAYLWRNNTGAATDPTGRVVRYGLANDSASMSKQIKSSDLIGMTPHIVRPEDVGRMIAIFTSIEVKRPGWKYTGIPREVAQLKWVEMVVSRGGIARFATGPGDIWPQCK